MHKMAVKKTDYMDITLAIARERLQKHVDVIRKMIIPEYEGAATYENQYIRMIAAESFYYYDFITDVWYQAMRQVDIKQRHRVAYYEIQMLMNELNYLAQESGFAEGLRDAMKE